MPGWKHYDPLWKWSSVVILGAPFGAVLITSHLSKTAGLVVTREHFGQIWGFACALMGLGLLFPLLTLNRASIRKPGNEPTELIPPPDELRRLYLAKLERFNASLAEKRDDPLPTGLRDDSPVGRYLQRVASSTREMGPDQTAAFVLASQYGRSRDAFDVGKILLPVISLVFIWILSSVAMVFVPWWLLRHHMVITVILVVLTGCWNEWRVMLKTRAAFGQMAAADLAVAQAMDDPHQFVRALKMMEQHDVFPEISGRRSSNPFSYRRRREHLEQALQAQK